MTAKADMIPLRSPEVAFLNSTTDLSNVARIDVSEIDDSRLVFVTDPSGLGVQRYKVLRRKMCAAFPRGASLLVTSPAPGDGKTLTSLNLSFALAEGGVSTCLVDLDFRSPGVYPVLEHDPEGHDLASVLEGSCTLLDALRQIGENTHYVLGISQESRGHNGIDLASIRPLIYELRTRFTWVILDVVPAIPFSDVSELITEVDGALMVVRAGRTKTAMIPPTLEVLGNKLCGVVLNDAVIHGGDYYGYYDRGSKGKQRRTATRPGAYSPIRGINLDGPGK